MAHPNVALPGSVREALAQGFYLDGGDPRYKLAPNGLFFTGTFEFAHDEVDTCFTVEIEGTIRCSSPFRTARQRTCGQMRRREQRKDNAFLRDLHIKA